MISGKKLCITAILCALSGMLWYSLQQRWLIINIPGYSSVDTIDPLALPLVPQQKNVLLFFWAHQAWHQENTQIVWNEYKAQNMYYLINSWLSLLDDEKLIPKKVSLQAAMFNPSNTELYLSFDRSLFYKESSTYEKWMLIESLLKTLRENDATTHTVRLLIHHQPMTDPHLDFSSGWPIGGFLNT